MIEFLGVGAALFIVLLVLFIAPTLGALFGAFAGWTVSIICPIWVTTGLHLLGFKDITPADLVPLGACLGFVGGFFKSSLSLNKDKNKK